MIQHARRTGLRAVALLGLLACALLVVRDLVDGRTDDVEPLAQATATVPPSRAEHRALLEAVQAEPRDHADRSSGKTQSARTPRELASPTVRGPGGEATLVLRVVTEEETPIPGVRLSVQRGVGWGPHEMPTYVRSQPTGIDGRLRVVDLPCESVNVYVDLASMPRGLGLDPMHGTHLERAGETELTLVAHRSGELVVSVRDAARRLVPGATLLIESLVGNEKRLLRSDADGIARDSRIAPGSYRIALRIPALDPAWTGHSREARTTAVVRAGERTEVELGLGSSGVSCLGFVEDTDGVPVKGLLVRILREATSDGSRSGLAAWAFTDASGIYRVMGLAPGTYRAEFGETSKADSKASRGRVLLASAAKPIEFEVRGSRVVRIDTAVVHRAPGVPVLWRIHLSAAPGIRAETRDLALGSDLLRGLTPDADGWVEFVTQPRTEPLRVWISAGLEKPGVFVLPAPNGAMVEHALVLEP